MTVPNPVVADPSQQKLPGLAGIWVGIALIVVGIVVGIALIIGGVIATIDGVEEMERVPIADGGTVEIDEAGAIAVYAERELVGNTTTFGFQPRVEVEVVRPDGDVVGLSSTSSFDQTYSWNGREGFLLGRFQANEPGTYELRVVLGDNVGSYDTLAVGDPFDVGGLVGIGVGMLVGGLCVLVGIILVIVFAVRRSRARRARDTAWMMARGGGAPGWGGPYAGYQAAPGYGPASGYGPAPGYTPPPAAPGPPWGAPPPASPNPPGWAPPPPAGAPVPPAAPAEGSAVDPTTPQPWTPPASSTDAPETSPDGPTEPIP